VFSFFLRHIAWNRPVQAASTGFTERPAIDRDGGELVEGKTHSVNELVTLSVRQESHDCFNPILLDAVVVNVDEHGCLAQILHIGEVARRLEF